MNGEEYGGLTAPPLIRRGSSPGSILTLTSSPPFPPLPLLYPFAPILPGNASPFPDGGNPCEPEGPGGDDVIDIDGLETLCPSSSSSSDGVLEPGALAKSATRVSSSLASHF